jgi:lipopolysaccharide transport system permease protein
VALNKLPTATSVNSPELPENPLVLIKPSKNWSALNLRDLWHYRDLLYILAARDVKVRYKQTIFGVAWAILQPLFTMLVFSLFFGKLAGMPSDGIPYPLFAYVGLLVWGFFSNALTKSGNSLVANANLITKVYFPRMVVPISAIFAALVDFLVASVFLIILLVYYGVGFSLNILMLPLLIVMTFLLAFGLGLWMSGLNVKYRDVGQALPFLIQLGFFVSPIIFPLSIMPEKWRWLMSINPVTGLVEGFRAAFFGRPFDWFSLAISAVVTCGILVFATLAFSRMEDEFADVI